MGVKPAVRRIAGRRTDHTVADVGAGRKEVR